MSVLGFLDLGSQTVNSPFVAAFRQGLEELDYTDSQNVKIEYRRANGDYNRLPALAADLARIPVAVLSHPWDANGATSRATVAVLR